MARRVAVVLGAMLLAGCAGPQAREECRQRERDCMAGCPANLVDRPTERGFGSLADTRSEGERRCGGGFLT